MGRSFADKFNDPNNNFATREEWETEKRNHFQVQAKKLKITGKELEEERVLFNQEADKLISAKYDKPVQVPVVLGDDLRKGTESIFESFRSTPQKVAKAIIDKQKEVKTRAEEGGFWNAMQFGFAGSGLGGYSSSKLNTINEGKIYRQTEFKPETIPEKAGEIAGSLLGDIPLFAKGPLLGFAGNRVLRELNRQEDDPQNKQIGLDFEKIAIEAGKGVAERVTFGAAGRISSGIAGKLLPKQVMKLGSVPGAVSVPVPKLVESGLLKGLGRGTIQTSFDTAAVMGMNMILDGAEFSGETAFTSAIMASMFRAKHLVGKNLKGAGGKLRTEAAVRVLAKTNNMPLKDARYMVRAELGFTELYRQKVGEKKLEVERTKVNDQEVAILQKEAIAKQKGNQLLDKRAETLSDVDYQLQEFNRQQNNTINVDHFVSDSAGLKMKAFQKTNNNTFDVVQRYNNNEKVYGEIVKNINVQKGLGERVPTTSNIVRNMRDANRYLGTSWGQAIAKDTVAGAIHVKRQYNYYEAMEKSVGHVDVQMKNILGQFDKGVFNKHKIIKKVGQRDFKMDEAGGKLMTRLLMNDPMLHDQIIAKALKNKKLSPKVAENIKQAYPEMRELFDRAGHGFKDTGGQGIDKNGKLVPFEIIEKNYATRIPDMKKIAANPDGFMKAMHELNEFDGDTVYTSEKWKTMPHKQKVNHALNYNEALSVQMKMPKSGYQFKRHLKHFPENYLDLDFRKQHDYIKDITSRIELNKHFGGKAELLNKDFEAIQNEVKAKGFTGKEANAMVKRAQVGMDAFMGKMDKGTTVVNDMFETVMNLNVANMMTTSFIAQPTQAIQALVGSNTNSFLKNLGILVRPKAKVMMGSGSERRPQQVFKNKEARLDWIKQAGINLDITRKVMYDAMLGKEGILKRAAEGTLKYTQFERFDAGNRTMAGLSGMFYADWLAHRSSLKITNFLKKNKLKSIDDAIKDPRLSAKLDQTMKHETGQFAKLGIDPGELLLQGTRKGSEFLINLNEAQKMTAARSLEVTTNFRTRFIDLPEFRKSTWGRAVSQFGSFDFLNTKHVVQNVYKEAIHGNFQPLKYGLTVGLGVGAASIMVRQLLTKSMVNIAHGENLEEGTLFKKLMDEDYGRALMDILPASLLVPMHINKALSFAKYGDIGLGPTVTRGLSLGKSARDFGRSGDPTILADEMVKQFSPAGYASKKMFQPWFDDWFNIKKKKRKK